MSNFVIYLIGTALVAAGLAYAASKLGLSGVWITVIVLVVIGFGIMAGVSKTRHKEKPD